MSEEQQRIIEEQAKTIKSLEAKLEATKHSAGSGFSGLKEHLWRIVDRIDPVESVAIISATALIHQVIITSKPLLDQIVPGTVNAVVSAVEAFPIAASTLLEQEVFGPFVTLYWGITGGGPGEKLQASAEQSAEIQKVLTDLYTTIVKSDFLIWGTSFLIAFLLVRYGGDIITAMGNAFKGLTSFISFLLPGVSGLAGAG